MSFQIFLGAGQQARLEKMRLDYLVWKDKSSKQMEEHMRRIKALFGLQIRPMERNSYSLRNNYSFVWLYIIYRNSDSVGITIPLRRGICIHLPIHLLCE
jgi:hypothetical protein